MADDSLDDDCRLRGQEQYLSGVTLYFRAWSQSEWDHDRCAFCAETFSDKSPDTLREGYTTADRFHWICVRCFADFRERFQWRVGSNLWEPASAPGSAMTSSGRASVVVMPPISWPVQLSDNCQTSLDHAVRFARWHSDGIILPSHALIGVIDQGDGFAAAAMQRAGVDLAALRVKLVLRLRVRRTLPRRLKTPVPSPVLLGLLERALEVSRSEFNHRYVGTEHLYLTLLRANVPAIVETLADVGHSPSNLEQQLFELLREPLASLLPIGPPRHD